MRFLSFMAAMAFIVEGERAARFSWPDGTYVYCKKGAILNEGDEPYIVTMADIMAEDWVEVSE